VSAASRTTGKIDTSSFMALPVTSLEQLEKVRGFISTIIITLRKGSGCFPQ